MCVYWIWDWIFDLINRVFKIGMLIDFLIMFNFKKCKNGNDKFLIFLWSKVILLCCLLINVVLNFCILGGNSIMKC